MIAISGNRRRSLGALAVLAVLYIGATGAASASAADTGPDGAAAPADMSVSVQAQISTPATSQDPDATVTLDYAVRNTGLVPIYEVRLDDPLVPGGVVDCDGSPAVQVLRPDAAVACSASIELPPGSYVSRPQARGWFYILVLAFPVTASGRTSFTVPPAPPPPSTPPPSSAPPPPPPTTPPASVAAPAPSTSRAPAAATPPAPARTPAADPPTPTTSQPTKTPAPPSPDRPSPSPAAHRRAVNLPAVPAAQVRRLPTHVTVLLLLLPAAVGAAVAGAAALRRR
jgi:hypothetical protein